MSGLSTLATSFVIGETNTSVGIEACSGFILRLYFKTDVENVENVAMLNILLAK
jgi:hypothetical protein